LITVLAIPAARQSLGGDSFWLLIELAVGEHRTALFLGYRNLDRHPLDPVNDYLKARGTKERST